ncbi:MAG: hypothetical protein JWP97_2660 [Labilithrix sp.]|nr:hypothetical protein [Labilithrix sp.]
MARPLRLVALLTWGAAFTALGALTGLPACGSDERELFVRPYDAAVPADATDEDGPVVDPTLGGPCSEDAQCDDRIACTFDRCDQALSRCRNTPDDSLCADSTYCNGREVCVLRQGCAAGPPVTCQDDSVCSSDRCNEATKTCEHATRDLDGDGDPDDHCVSAKDCDDLDPDVSSTHSEVCGNFKDDNCNGQVDEPGCVAAQSDVCATAFPVTASGTYLLTTAAAKKDYATSCSVATASAAKDVVVAITVPGAAGDPPKNVEVRAAAQVSTNEVALALQTACGQAATEVSCGHTAGTARARAIARSVPAGSVLSAIVVTQQEGAVDLVVDITDAAPRPTNESCAAPEPVAVGTPFTVHLVDPAKDLPTDCAASQTGELTYAFTLAAAQDVRIFASTLSASGDPVVSLRDATCAGELRCRAGAAVPVFARSLAAGTHVFTVSGTEQLDASIVVRTYPPTAPPPNQSCATAPPIAVDQDVLVDLSAQEDAIDDGCFPGSSSAAYALVLTEPSDVLAVARFAQNETGSISIDAPGCTTGDLLACAKGATPQRVSRRNLPAGSYRIVVSDSLAQSARVTVLVRPTTPPTVVNGAAGCAGAVAVAAGGGFFTGDTTGRMPSESAGCDAPGQPVNGAPDQLLRLDLAQPRRVVLDMSGSFYTTILDVRAGGTCPGAEVPDACYVGFQSGRSFLDLPLAAGTYWLQVDGYAGQQGAWNLDARILPP